MTPFDSYTRLTRGQDKKVEPETTQKTGRYRKAKRVGRYFYWNIMKKQIIILSIAFFLVAIIGGCKKDESGKTGQVTFSGGFDGKSNATYTVTINGQSGTFINSSPAPECGTISDETANFALPVGTYTFTFTGKYVSYFDNSVRNDTYSGTKSVTITDGGCVSVRWN